MQKSICQIQSQCCGFCSVCAACLAAKPIQRHGYWCGQRFRRWLKRRWLPAFAGLLEIYLKTFPACSLLLALWCKNGETRSIHQE